VDRSSADQRSADQRITLVERTLAITEQLTHIGSWEWQLQGNTVRWSDELYRIYGFAPQSQPITPEFFLSRVYPDDRELVQQGVRQALEQGGLFHWRERIVRPDGSLRVLDTVGEVLTGEHSTSLFGTCRDITEEQQRLEEQTRERRLQAAEQAVLEQVATGAPLTHSLETLIRAVEEHAPPTIGSILLVDDEGIRVRHGAAPGLASTYQAGIDGSRIGPKAGSCGTAAFLRRPVFVDDIDSDPLWDDFRALAQSHGLRACWSTPILSTDQRVLGTFAFYYQTPRKPTAADQALVQRASRLAGVAIERQQMEAQLRNLSAHVQAALEHDRTRIAREIHDDLGQSLTALKMDIAWILRRRAANHSAGSVLSDEIAEKLASMSEFTDGVIQRVREISSELRPGVLDDLGLVAAIEWQAEAFQERTGTQCLVRCDGALLEVGRELSTAAFRIFQEALTNVARHADAQCVRVCITTRDSEFCIEIEDDGVGIAPERANNPTSLGLLGLRERAHRLNGDVFVVPIDPHGTRVSLRLPFRPGGST